MRNIRIHKPFILLISLILFSGPGTFAQESQAKASMDTSRILIGDHVNIILELNIIPGLNCILYLNVGNSIVILSEFYISFFWFKVS